MSKWMVVSIVLAVLLVASVGVNVLTYLVANQKITELQRQLNETESKVIPGVYLYKDQLTIKNKNIKSVYFNPAGVYVLDKGNRVITENNEFDLEVYVLGLYPIKSVSTWKVTPGVHYTCVNLDNRDGLRVVWKVVNGSASDWKVRLFNETGFEAYREVITNYDPANPNSVIALTIVEKGYQLMGSNADNQKEGAFSLGQDHGSGRYCAVFENWGDEPLEVDLRMVVEKHLKLVDNS